MKRLSRRLLQKSQEAFVLGVEVFNKPSIKYRLEGFSFFFVNAWELLLKARIIEMTGNSHSIFRKPKRGQLTAERDSIGVDDALRVVFPDQKNAVRRNVDAISGLRNAATHLVVAELEPVYVGLFQAGVLNYVSLLDQWFGIKITDKITPGMLSLVFDLHDIEPLAIKRRYGKEVLDFIDRQRAIVRQDDMSDPQFCIPVDYRLVLSKKVSEADIALTTGTPANLSATVVQIPKDIETTHPYLRSDVIKKVQERLGEECGLTPTISRPLCSRRRFSSRTVLTTTISLAQRRTSIQNPLWSVFANLFRAIPGTLRWRVRHMGSKQKRR